VELEEAETEVMRSWRDMYNGTKEAEDWVMGRVRNDVRMQQVALLAMKTERWQPVMRDILADAMSSFAERKL